MTEPISKWGVASCLIALLIPGVAVWLAASPMSGVQGATVEVRQGEGTLPVAARSGAERQPSSSTSTSIRTSLAGVSASAFEPARDGIVNLATFGATPKSAVLNVPAPGSLSAAAPATDRIPEPGAIGFGLAVAALILGNFAKALMRCWKITSTAPGREP